MTMLAPLCHFLKEEGIFSAEEMEKISISLAIGEVPRRHDRLTRRYIVATNNQPQLSVKFVPRRLEFPPDDILKTQSLYAGLDFIKVPRRLGHFSSSEGHFFLEEYLPAPISLAQRVEAGELSGSQAAEVVRKVLSEIWTLGEAPSQDFIRQEKEKYRDYLAAYIPDGPFKDIIGEFIAKVIDENASSLRQVWSSGDIIDRNILWSDGRWYLVDFEYCHQTLFYFKEGYRTILFSKWAEDLSLRELFPYLDNFPEAVARLISLAWESHLQSQVLDKRSESQFHGHLRRLFWDTFDDNFTQRLDKYMAIARETLAQKEEQARQLQATVQAQQQALARGEEQVKQLAAEQERLDQQTAQLQATVQAQQQALAEGAEQAKQQEEQIKYLRAEQERLAGQAAYFQAQQREIDMIRASVGWKLLSQYWQHKDRLLPYYSMRKKLYDWILTGPKKWLINRQAPRKDQRKQVLPQTQTPPLGQELAGAAKHKQEPLKAKPKEESVGAREIHDAALPSQCRRFTLYVSSLGNYFFYEIRDLIASALEELGFEVSLRDERAGFDKDADWHIVIAPHEFFCLGAGAKLQKDAAATNLILITTEQPLTQWFSTASDYFPLAHRIWDISYQAAQLIAQREFACDYLPLGYVAGFNRFQEVKELPDHYGTCFLDPEIRRKSYLNEPLANRPIDVAFMGTLTDRRENFFAQAAPLLSEYLCYLHLADVSAPLIQGQTTCMDTTTVIGLIQRSKILLNIHRGESNYFEWHRIVMHGIWQRTLVISEPCSIAAPFRSGIDFVEASAEEIPDKIRYYLSSPQGRTEAEAIATQGFRTLTEKCRLADRLRPLILQLHPLKFPSRFWPPATPPDAHEAAEDQTPKLELISAPTIASQKMEK